MRFSTFILFLFVCSIANGQIIKEQIGTSIWYKGKEIISDSSTAYIISYDKKGRKTKEWQVYRNIKGEVTDTNIVELDTFERLIHFYSSRCNSYYTYDSLGSMTSLRYICPNYKLKITYLPQYDSSNVHISSIQIWDGDQNNKSTIYYSYVKGFKIENNGPIITKEKRNSRNQLLYSECIQDIPGQKKQVDIKKYKRDSKGNVLYFVKKQKGVLTKTTKHFFYEGLELYQIETFYNPDYKIVTKFKYVYY